MSSDKILGHVQDCIGHIVFNNPEKHNAVSLDMWVESDRGKTVTAKAILDLSV